MQPARPEYGQLAQALAWHATTFGVALRPGAQRDVGVLMTAMEAVDRAVDGQADEGERRALADAVVAFLRGGRADVPPVLAPSLTSLREVLEAQDCVAAFVDLTAEAFDVSERIRCAVERRSYLAGVLREGQITPRMTLLVLGPTDPRFTAFFLSLGDVGNFVDELVDARDDWRRGERALRPGVGVHASLIWWLLKGTVAAASHHPQPLRLLAWGSGFLLRPAMAAARGPS